MGRSNTQFSYFIDFSVYFCFRVDKLSASIETQTEMLEKVVKLFTAKENEAIPHPSLDAKL